MPKTEQTQSHIKMQKRCKSKSIFRRTARYTYGKRYFKNFQNLIASDFDDNIQGKIGVANNLTGLKGKDTFL